MELSDPESNLLGHIRDEEVVGLLRQLIRIPSENPPGNEKDISEFLRKEMSSLGLRTSFIEPKEGRVNVIGELKGSYEGPTLIFNCHTDTKPAIPSMAAEDSWKYDPFEGIVENGRVYGRGASDMKGGLASVMAAIKAVVNAGVEMKGSIIVQCVADEEMGSGLGTMRLLEEGLLKGDAAIVPEPTGLEICPAELGALWLEILVKGRMGHAGRPWLAVNAIRKAIKIVDALDKDVSRRRKKLKHKMFPKHPTLNVGAIEGGHHPGTVPGICKLLIDTRLVPGETIRGCYERIKDILKRLQEEDREEFVVESKLFATGGADPCEISQKEPIVGVAKESYRKVLGKKAPISGFTGFSDARILVNDAHIPTIVFGPGTPGTEHTINEYAEVQKVVDAAKIFALIIVNFTGSF